MGHILSDLISRDRRERAERSCGMSLGETAACLSRNLNSYLLAVPTTSCNSRLWRDLCATANESGEKKT